MRTRAHASEIDAECEKDPRAKVPKGKEKVTNGENNPQARMTISFSGSPLSDADFKKI